MATGRPSQDNGTGLESWNYRTIWIRPLKAILSNFPAINRSIYSLLRVLRNPASHHTSSDDLLAFGQLIASLHASVPLICEMQPSAAVPPMSCLAHLPSRAECQQGRGDPPMFQRLPYTGELSGTRSVLLGWSLNFKVHHLQGASFPCPLGCSTRWHCQYESISLLFFSFCAGMVEMRGTGAQSGTGQPCSVLLDTQSCSHIHRVKGEKEK